MTVDFEALTPSWCVECPVLQGAILRRRTFIAQTNRIIEGNFEDGVDDISTSMRKINEIEERVISELSHFVVRCVASNPVIESVGCRIPPSEWRDIA